MNNDYKNIRLISAGVKVFSRSEFMLGSRKESSAGPAVNQEQHFRILNEGLLAVLPYVARETLVDGDAEVLRTMLQAYYPLCASFTEPFRSKIESRRAYSASRCLCNGGRLMASSAAVGSCVVCFKPANYGEAT